MATLVLTAAGALLGPVGGAVGALIGQAIDMRLLAPKGRQGPRLQDLKVQTSSYGAPIPKLFGTMRVAGTVIWATDLIERQSRQGGGKGRPRTTTYSYTASFAVLLSGRPIRSVGRIWADGNLLRGAAGDWKSETGFRIHLGDEDQAVDPFVASAEAGEGTPAYRGCAYAVFEHMALEPFGSRIPSLTFEVEADAVPVTTGAMLQELSAGQIASESGTALRGFAATGERVSDLVAALRDGLPLMVRDDGIRLHLVEPSDPVVTLVDAEIGDEGTERLAAEADLPSALTLGYYEPERDYQAGVQAARRPGGRSQRRIELPAALSAGEARGVAEAALDRLARDQVRRTVRCGWARVGLAPGALVRLPGAETLWRVAERAIERDGVRLDLVRERMVSLVQAPTDPGRSVKAPDLLHGPTVVHLLDLPNLGDDAPTMPRLLIAAAGPSPGWRRASLLASLDQGVSWTAIGGTAAPAIMGTAATALAAAPAALIDRANSVEVQLLHGGMALEEADAARLLAGSHLAVIGSELIQFGRAEPLGAARWRLSYLLRGRRGTEAVAHAAGERFVLIEAEALQVYEPPASFVGGEVRVLASGMGDPVPVAAEAAAIGEALRPPPPVQLAARRRNDGGFDLSWCRSSRLGWTWLDGVDAPLGEAEERYRLEIEPAGQATRVIELSSTSYLYESAQVFSDLASGPAVIRVAQLGAGMASRSAHLILQP